MRQSLAEWISQRAGMHRPVDATLSSPRTSESELDRYQERVKQLLSVANQQATDLASERTKRLRTERRLESVRSELKESQKDRRNLKRTLRRASRELNSLRHGSELPAITKLCQQLVQIQNQVVESFGQEQNLRVRAETKLKTLQKEVKTLQQSQTVGIPSRKSLINERVEEERGRRRKAEKESRNLKRKLRHTSRSLNTLRRDHSKCGRRFDAASSNGAASRYDFIGVLLPNLMLARDGDLRLLRARETKQVFDHLLRLNNDPQSVRGDRVGSADPWLEMRPNPTPSDRIYYRKATPGRGYIVLVGDKNSQSSDIEWLKRNR